VLETLSLIMIGVVLGTVTGLTPGLHINTVLAILLSFSALLLDYTSIKDVVALIVAMSVTHSFVDFIPAVLIGAPREDSVLSVLPGHRLLREGRGYEAVRLTVLGGVGSILISIAILPLALVILPTIYASVKGVLAYLLMAILVYMVATEKNPKRMVYACGVIAYSGVLGVIILSHPPIPGRDVLFPTLTGLFGVSTLLLSTRSSGEIPRQTLRYGTGMYSSGVLAGAVGGMLTGLLPGVGSSQSALMIHNLMGKRGEKNFLVALGGVNTSDSIYALLALYLISNPRSGASIAVERLTGELSREDFLFIVAVIMLTAFFAAYITLALGRILVEKMQNISYRPFSMTVLLFLVLLVFGLTGWRGLLILVTASAIGLLAPLTGVKRTHCMAVLITPTVLYYLHLQ
jgi:putative membrane protein